jgi:hypothetical protein
VPDDPPPSEPSAEAGACPRCGTPYAAGQEYCLECGLRLPETHSVVASLGSAWQRRLGYYPGDWIWPALVGLVIAGLATAIVIAFTQGDNQPTTLVATQAPITGGETSTTTTTPTTETTPTTTATTATTTKPAPKQLISWPRGTSGFTVVLESIPTGAGRELAVQKAKSALGAGLTDVGVLNSSLYTSLHPGYYVVFSGVFESRPAAQSALATATSNGYPAAYVRQIIS